MNKEILEEAAIRLYPIDIVVDYDTNEDIRNIWIEGAKWQQEQFKNESTADYIDRHIVQAMVETAKQKMFNEEEDFNMCRAFSDVVMWLYKEHKIWISVDPENDTDTWFYTISHNKSEIVFGNYSGGPIEAYEKAIEHGCAGHGCAGHDLTVLALVVLIMVVLVMVVLVNGHGCAGQWSWLCRPWLCWSWLCWSWSLRLLCVFFYGGLTFDRGHCICSRLA